MADFDGRDFLSVSEDLVSGAESTNQAYLRTVAGRSYYAAYFRLRTLLKTNHCHAFGRAGKHTNIQTACIGDPHSGQLNLLGQKLKDIYTWRIRADYHHEATANIQPMEADDSIIVAKEAIAIIDGLQNWELAAIHNSI